MIKIGIIAAMQHEMELLKENIDHIQDVKIAGFVFFIGKINDHDIVLCQSGVGKVNSAIATSLMIAEFECNLIINTGICGGLGLKKRDVVITKEVRYHDFDASAFGYEYGQVPGMPKTFVPSIESTVMIKSVLSRLGINYKHVPVFTGDQFVLSIDQLKKANPGEVFACEMEGAGVAQACIRAGVEFIILRYVSDCIGDDNQQDDYNTFEEEMSNNSANICLQIINNL